METYDIDILTGTEFQAIRKKPEPLAVAEQLARLDWSAEGREQMQRYLGL